MDKEQITIKTSVEELTSRYADRLLHRDHNAHKGTYGRLTILAGSHGMAGAAYFAGLAAFRCGIGMVRYLGPECNRTILQTLLPEAMYDSFPDNADRPGFDRALAESLDWGEYLIVGPGLSKSSEAKQIIRALFRPAVREVLAKKKLILLDADALNIMAERGLDPGRLAAAGTPMVITPHVAEMSRLCGCGISEIEAAMEEKALLWSMEHNTAVVLKSAETVIACPGSEDLWRLDSGCGAMAKAGSGDVLCGFVAGIAAVLSAGQAEGMDGTDGADRQGSICLNDILPLAVHLHGRAGCLAAERRGEHSILARDIAEAAGAALQEAVG